MAKPRTQAQIDRATNQRLLKTYGITLEERRELETRCGNCCEICGEPPSSRGLHTDHDHSWKKVKVQYTKVGSSWEGRAVYLGRLIWTSKRTKPAVSQTIKAMLLKASVRGLLCNWHNRGLRYFQDNPEYLRSAARYLERHQEGNK